MGYRRVRVTFHWLQVSYGRCDTSTIMILVPPVRSTQSVPVTSLPLYRCGRCGPHSKRRFSFSSWLLATAVAHSYRILLRIRLNSSPNTQLFSFLFSLSLSSYQGGYPPFMSPRLPGLMLACTITTATIPFLWHLHLDSFTHSHIS